MEKLVWMDLEMTGLNPARDAVLEVAALVTDSELEPLDDGIDLVIYQPDDVLAGMVDVVRDMHAVSGLTEAVRSSTLTLAEAAEATLAWLRGHLPEPKKAPLCGNSIGTDRSFLAVHMPEVDGWLHYRMIDVSSVKELARRWYPKVWQHAPVKAGGHRALADIRESIEELRYYRAAIFVPPAAREPPPAAPAGEAADAAVARPQQPDSRPLGGPVN